MILRRMRFRLFVMSGLLFTSAAVVSISLGAFPSTASATPGSWTAAQVDAAIANGVSYIASQQQPDGAFGTTAPFAETGMGLIAFGVLASPNGVFNFANLSPAYQTDVNNAIAFLLTAQDTSGDATNGSWADDGEFYTYSTGIAIAGLSAFQSVNSAIPAAVTLGRNFLLGEFHGSSSPYLGGVPTGCSSANSSPTAYYCGGWNYLPYYVESDLRSDESNTGYAMFGLNETGGVPSAIQSDEVGWQNNIQSDTISNPAFAGSYNDGGGSYQPEYIGFFPYSNNANDTGSMLFSYAYDGVDGTDSRVVAGLSFAQDILSEYELEQGTSNADSMVYDTGTSADAPCSIGAAGCNWNSDPFEGGFHYSLFALEKGLVNYQSVVGAPNLMDPTNWYAKIVDLLLTQQAANGSWPQDGRDDASQLLATEFSISALGLVGAPKAVGAPNLNDVIQVETNPLNDGKTVTISSPQLTKACASVSFETLQGGSPTSPTVSPNSISVVLDADGNATVLVNGVECPPGRYTVKAQVAGTPAGTITGTTALVVNPPQITYPEGVTGYPANEVETGNTQASGNSDVYTVFQVETSPGDAEKTVKIASSALVAACGQGSRWESNDPSSPFVGSKTATAIVDDDGNAAFVFKGASCAAGTYKVTVTVQAKGHPKYTSTYSIDPPAVTYTGSSKHLSVNASPNPVILIGG